jgi:diguanylate cyclase (GGDEF)-like protein
MRILLIEDDEILADVLLQSLTSQNYIVDLVEDGRSGLEYAQSADYEIILTDVDLPQLDGITLCQKLRSEGSSTPILLITARDASQDRIKGLDAGADDYLTKPLDLQELHARVRALLRRGEIPHTPILQVGELRLDPSSCQVSYQNKDLKLTPKEYNLLEIFLRNPLRVFSRSQLIDHLWNFDDPPLDESVKAHIKGLRQKLKKAGVVDWIENVYGIGYRLNPPTEEAGVQGVGAQGENLDRDSIPNTSSSIAKPGIIPIAVEFDRKMGEMWQRYQGLMLERLEILQAAANAIENKTLSKELHQSAERAAHKLAGVLGMFEKEEGTKRSRKLESLLNSNESLSLLQQQEFKSLVEQLSDILALTVSVSTTPEIEPRLLLIDRDRQLGSQLQELANPEEKAWKQVDDISGARAWIQNHSPDLVVLSIEESEEWESSRSLLVDLAARTPSIPVLVLSSVDRLSDRVTVARYGSSGFLIKPIETAKIWDAVTKILQRDRESVPKILVVDDDRIFLAGLSSMLEPWGMKIATLEEPLRFWEVLQSSKPDLLILDVDMPEINGIELCSAVRSAPEWQELPILFLTARRDAKTIEEVFAIGADDYATKPIVGSELLTRISNRLERTYWRRKLVDRDLVTGLANRSRSTLDLEYLIQHQQMFTFGILTIDELHKINIKYGHQTGDRIISRVGNLLHSSFNGAEILSYWGYGEFIIGIPELNKTEVSDRLAEILKTLRQQIFTASDGDRFQITSHLALVEYPFDGSTLQSLYQIGCKRTENTSIVL